MPTRSDAADLLPLTPAVLHILLTLSEGPLHGYGIMKEVTTITDGQMELGPGTLYGSIKRMLEAELIEEVEPPAGEDLDNRPRRFYQLTRFGERVLAAEVARLSQLVEVARTRHLLPHSG